MVQNNQGFKIGFLGLAERDWEEFLDPELDLDDIKFEDWDHVITQESDNLKNQEKCDLVFAVTHVDDKTD